MKIMKNELIIELTKMFEGFFGPSSIDTIKVNFKDDKSLVTEIDLFISKLIKNKLQQNPQYSSYVFYCEEDHEEYLFPCAILDPIDGTTELVKGRPECVVSLALMQTPSLDGPGNSAWLYNPFTGFEIDTEARYLPIRNKTIQKLFTFVSRSEYKNGRFDKYLNISQLDITPKGSIAFKLGLLASGACDFIISLEPKNVWDIAAGTIICAQREIHFYENGIRITSLDRTHYAGVLIWAPAHIAPSVFSIFKREFKNEKTSSLK